MGDLTVFVVDDDDAYRELIELALAAGERVRVTSFASGPAVLDAIGEAPRAGTPGLLLLDLHMPGMTGLAVIRRLRSSGRFMPMVVFSNAASPAEKEQCAVEGAQLLPKPWSFDGLRAILHSVVEEARQGGSQRGADASPSGSPSP